MLLNIIYRFNLNRLIIKNKWEINKASLKRSSTVGTLTFRFWRIPTLGLSKFIVKIPFAMTTSWSSISSSMSPTSSKSMCSLVGWKRWRPCKISHVWKFSTTKLPSKMSFLATQIKLLSMLNILIETYTTIFVHSEATHCFPFILKKLSISLSKQPKVRYS